MSGGAKERGCVILYADDDEDAHFLLKRAFTKAGSRGTLLQVKDGSDVIEYLKGQGEFADRTKFPLPDLLLLDLDMPLSGLDVLAYLSNHPEHRTFPTVVLSSSERLDDVKKARALGCDAYLTKPCNFEKLVQWETLRLCRRTPEV